MLVKTEKVSFLGSLGFHISGCIDQPRGDVKAYAIYAHCFTCTKDIHATRRICEGLAAQGIAVLRFDFTGLGGSEGEFSETNFTSNVDDLKEAARFLREHYEPAQLMIGHSLGGTAALVATSQLDEIKAVVTLNSPCHPKHVAKHFESVHDEILWTGEADVTIEGRSFKIQKHFLDVLKKVDMNQVLADLDAAYLICHTPNDSTVNVKNAGYLFSIAKHPKSYVSLDDSDHLIRRREDAKYIADIIAPWASRYLDIKEKEKPLAAEGQVTVRETREGKFTQAIAAGNHFLVSDEPRSIAGGLDKGPSPYDYLLAGLGACTSMTLRMYADFKNIPLERVKVTLNHEKIHAKDCRDCGTKKGKIDQIKRTLYFEGPLSEEQKESLLRVADKCPVHRTLHNEIEILTEEDR